MKKKLLMTAVGVALALPAVSFADFANFNASGRVRVGVDQSKLSGPNGPYHSRLGVDDNLSGFVLAGSEEVSGDLKAWFSVETRFSPDIGPGSPISGLAYGNTGAGLQGGWGKLTVGRWDLHYTELLALEGFRAGSVESNASIGLMAQVANPNGTSQASYVANGRRTDNLVMWDSPNLGGITARIAYSTAFNVAEGANAPGTYTTTDPGKDGAYNLALRYSGNGVVAGVSRWVAKVEGETATTNQQAGDQQSTRAWVGYTFPFGLKLGVGYDQSEWRFADDAPFTKRTALEVPVSYNVGSHTPYVVYAKANKLTGGAAGQNNDDTGATQLTVGYDYALSKRTTLGLSYAEIKNDLRAGYNGYGAHAAALAGVGGTGAVRGDKYTQIFLGMQHAF